MAVTFALVSPAPGGGLRLAAPAGAQSTQVLVVSRGQVLDEASAARRLAASEQSATDALQREIDAVKLELAAEEEELTRLRTTLSRDEFELRVAAFDQRVREERRRAQSLAASLQRAYRDARRHLVEALGPILEEVRVERGALAVIDAESVLAVDESIDVTARAIELFDERVSVPVVVMPDEPGARMPGGQTPGEGMPGATPVPGAVFPPEDAEQAPAEAE
ncbi:OmpH family outer membrane protein [Limibaculum sp. M0105]|uniref:OmpH family outer membrane protein n=1 Tax=Thermohalobaculum xanthum TaxID=2753746 RepID=A0A8J7M6N0_9RHOB|nr:OmpH family outer membrane protein [Thermohalobaculum xanthum]MBK0398827.1 OmpH family outer membrane protein [Thermohalobaculum xanthum]